MLAFMLLCLKRVSAFVRLHKTIVIMAGRIHEDDSVKTNTKIQK
jgi:hypothetical protein